MSNLNQSMQPVASFTFATTDKYATKRLCLFPGHYDTSEIVGEAGDLKLGYANPSAIKNAGYDCNQVADDFLYTQGKSSTGVDYPIVVTPKSSHTRYRDFLNLIRYSNLRVVKMRITDLSGSTAHEIFQQSIEVTKSSVGSKHGSDFIQLSQHINPSNFLQTFIEIDLKSTNLLLDETTLAFIDIPADAKFQIDFTLAE